MSAPRSCARRMVTATLQQKRQYSAPTDGSIPPNKAKYVPSSGTYPKGFFVGSAHAQVKKSNTKFDDVALIASEKPCAAALVTTQNAFQAAPVAVSKAILSTSRGKRLRGLIINSGCANAVTGSQGREDALKMSHSAHKALQARFPAPSTQREAAAMEQDHELPELDPKDQTAASRLRSLVMSTGVIGQCLPIDRITNKIPELVDSLGDSHDHWLRTARAICTTDTFPKLLSRQYTLPSFPGITFSMAGMTKGAGMIHPNMATLLGAICTDAPIHPVALRCLLRTATHNSFNCITVDGDTSTNDSIALFANGMAAPEDAGMIRVEGGREELKELVVAKRSFLSKQSEDYKALYEVLNSFMQDLAKLIVRDGEGATKFVTIRVQGANNSETAKRVAMSVAQSSLVKTALYGKDANWGRILCAIGYAPGANYIKPDQTSVSFVPTDGSEELKLLVNGEPQVVNEERAKVILEMEDLEINVTLSDLNPAPPTHAPTGSAVVYTCDFSHEYVTINGDYRT